MREKAPLWNPFLIDVFVELYKYSDSCFVRSIYGCNSRSIKFTEKATVKPHNSAFQGTGLFKSSFPICDDKVTNKTYETFTLTDG